MALPFAATGKMDPIIVYNKAYQAAIFFQENKKLKVKDLIVGVIHKIIIRKMKKNYY